jgi:hypothetical protein
MAYCGAVGLLDKDGQTIDVLRFADDPSEGAERAKRSLRAWFEAAIAKRPNLAVVTLGDGTLLHHRSPSSLDFRSPADSDQTPAGARSCSLGGAA